MKVCLYCREPFVQAPLPYASSDYKLMNVGKLCVVFLKRVAACTLCKPMGAIL